MADTTEKTLADELREAAARAREHLVPSVTAWVLPQSALVVLCGSHEAAEEMCRNCMHFSARDRVLARLVAALINAREPLASWLEQVAEEFGREVITDTPECPNCGEGCAGHDDALVHDDGCGNWLADADAPGLRCECFDPALAVARLLNGTAS
ncbi:hypothetical protein [Nonomuraea wenchangensis]|uniref:hypothetical protein n=1 Tax=Nonomuraea wenchangensis TaxID=568860 RepID=UPI00333337DB